MRKQLLCCAIGILTSSALVACEPYYHGRYYPYDPYGPPPGFGPYGPYPPARPCNVPQSLSQTSYDFVINLALSNSYQIEAGRLARLRSASSQVRQFAERVIVGNTTVTRNLMATLQRNGTSVVTPRALDPHHQSMIGDLSMVQGANFDQRYIVQQVLQHRETIAMLQNYVQNGDNPALRQLAQQTLPAAQAGLQLVQTFPGAAGG